VELATTEVNMLELAYLTQVGTKRLRAARRDTLVRLRRKLTILPIDQRAFIEASRRVFRGDAPTFAPLSSMLGALAASGCDEFFTSDPSECTGRWGFSVTRFIRHSST